MTRTERVEALRALGYTAREAEFMSSYAAPSGYFLRRQFNAHLGRECGALGQAFIERTIRLGHARPLRFCAGAVVYHVCGRGLYAALGEEDNRNRREHSPETVKRRVMSLDFMIESPGRAFVATDVERAAFFEAKRVEKCCAERHPIYTESGRLLTGFCYVDAGDTTTSGLRTYCQNHRHVFSQLSQVELVYLTSRRQAAVRAEAALRAFCTGEQAPAVDAVRVMQHFRERQRFEAKDFSSFDQAGLDRFRKERAVFSGELYDRLYEEWKTKARIAQPGGAAKLAVRFLTHVLSYDYGLFGGFMEESRNVSHPETD